MKRANLLMLLCILVCLVVPMITFAQGPPDPNDTPIDGGLSLLLAAGVGYGVKKYRGRKKGVEEDNC